MNAKGHIYRSEAVARYVAARQDTILPRMVRPQTLGYLWAGLLLFMLVSFGAWWTEIPAYQAGLGILVVPTTPTTPMEIVAFFPAEREPELGEGEALVVTIPSGERLILTIHTVSDRPLSPAEVRARYGSQVDSNAVRVPVMVASATLDPARLGSNRAVWSGTIFPVEARTGRYRLLSMIPIIGEWFQNP